MTTSTASEDRAVDEIQRRCTAGLDQRALLGEVAERLRRAIPSEAFCLSATDPSSKLVTYGAAEGLGGMRGMRLFFEHIYLEADVNGYDGMSERWPEPVMLLSEATGDGSNAHSGTVSTPARWGWATKSAARAWRVRSAGEGSSWPEA